MFGFVMMTAKIYLQVRRARPSCELSPCLNGGTCVDSVSPPYYRCICPSPRHAKLPLGAHCEPLSSCDSMPCPDHSTCVVVDALGAYRCVCDNDDCAQVAGAVTSLRPRDILGEMNCDILNPLECRGNYSARSNNIKLVHWPLIGGLLHLVQRGGDWWAAARPVASSLYQLIGTLKPQGNGPLYSKTVIGTLAVDGWVVQGLTWHAV